MKPRLQPTDWRPLRWSRLVVALLERGWTWGYTPGRRYGCVVTPGGQVFEVRMNPTPAIRRPLAGAFLHG